MGSTPNNSVLDDMVDEILNGNFTEQEDGREKLVAASMINDGVDGTDKIEASAPATKPVAKMIYGVRISCNGEQDDGLDKYVTVMIPSDDIIFKLPPTQLSKAMGLELIIQQAIFAGQIVRDPITNINCTAAYLHRPVDPEKTEFGYFNIFLTTMTYGPVNVVRADMKPITPEQVEAIAVFARFHIDEEYRLLTRIAVGAEEEHVLRLARRAFVKEKLARAAFERFFERYQSGRAAVDKVWASVISPYEL
jgi:hypothetical protein